MEPYIGEIRMFAGTFAPKGWLLCDGTAYDPNRYANLHSIIQEIYGTSGAFFRVPDLRGRSPIHWGQGEGLSPRDIGSKAGAETVTLTVPQLPAHNHTINAKVTGNAQTPKNNFFGAVPLDPVSGKGVDNWADASPDAVMNQGTVNLTGNGQAVNIVSPILTVTYIIAWEGIYPSRP